MGPSTLIVLALVAHTAAARPASVRLDRLTWPEAQEVLRTDAVVLIPLGAAAAQHGPHLTLGTDLVLAEYLGRRVADRSSVILAPTIPYHHYPAFDEYPGSTSLSLATARDLTADVIRSVARFGPRRFYVLNMGISGEGSLQAAASALAAEGILMRYVDVTGTLATASRAVRQQDGGNHADEVETSMMLHVDSASVDMKAAARDFSRASQPFRLTRTAGAPGTYSRTGIWGDATLATKEKGTIVIDRLVSTLVDEVEQLRSAPLPSPTTQKIAMPARAIPIPPAAAVESTAASCTAGDERRVREIAEIFTVAWTNQDYERLADLWTDRGDIVHPDGWIERTRVIIKENRRELFRRREYRQSRHPLTLTMIRCISPDVAVADGKWELREVFDSAGKIMPPVDGLATVVARRYGPSWFIEAYRYTLRPTTGTLPPTILKRPGYPGAQ